jgi:hypothetical protein
MIFLLLFLLMSEVCMAKVEQLRDPFNFAPNIACSYQKLMPIHNEKCTLPIDKNINEKEIDGWQIKQVLDEKVILQNSDGALREVSFEKSTNEKK